MAVIIGIDPGSHKTGWGIVDVLPNSTLKCLDYGVLELSSGENLAARLSQLHQELSVIVQKYNPHAISIEKIFLGKNADSAFKLGHARGVVFAVAGQFSLNLFEYATRSIKKMITGHGGSEKEQLKFVIENLLNVKINSLDASDALALAIGHAQQAEVIQRLADQNRSVGL